MFDRKRRRRESVASRVLLPEAERALDAIPLYRRLPLEDRRELHRHIQVLLDEKHYEGAAGFAVDDGVRLVIAAQAGILLLHRDTDYYPKLHSIIVYPSEYIAPIEDMDEYGLVVEDEESRVGESWTAGGLVLSWEDVRADLGDRFGAANVVLHEFAHQLDAESGSMNGCPPMDRALRGLWSDVLGAAFAAHCLAVDHGGTTVLDPYAAEDPAEFFAVSVETFFQRPRLLLGALPQIYDALHRYFRQDPAAWPKENCDLGQPV